MVLEAHWPVSLVESIKFGFAEGPQRDRGKTPVVILWLLQTCTYPHKYICYAHNTHHTAHILLYAHIKFSGLLTTSEQSKNLRLQIAPKPEPRTNWLWVLF